MRVCCRCKVPGDDESFHPNQPVDKGWCKLCVQKRVDARRKKNVGLQISEALTAEREQAAIRAVVKQFQTDGSSFVYVIEGVNRYKIGFSTDVDKRMRTLNTAACSPHRLRAVVPGGLLLEQELHKRFHSLWINREWFARDVRIIRYVSEMPGAMVFLPAYISQDAPAPLDVSSAA